VTIHRNATVEAAAQMMRASHIGNVIVVDATETRKPVGIITDRDIAVEVVAQGLVPAQTTVGSVMSAPVVSLSEDDSFIEALDKMSARGVRRAPVLDRDGRLKGLVSVDDLVPLIARELAKIGALIRHGQAAEMQKTKNAFTDEFAA
jgi:CBS domain-containing protein